jgi:hypothetical protein
VTTASPNGPHVRRWWIVFGIIAGLCLLLGANAHFVYVAFSSQPDCVDHLKAPGETGTFRAANSAC